MVNYRKLKRKTLVLLNDLNKKLLLIFVYCFFSCHTDSATEYTIITKGQSSKKASNETLIKNDSIPAFVKKLMLNYKSIVGFENNYLVFSDGTRIIYDDHLEKNNETLLNSSDIEDMFHYQYKHWGSEIIPQNYDPGRVRCEAFFNKIYGSSKAEVEKKLVNIVWCPLLVNQKIMVTKINNVHLKVEALSKELDQHPEFKKYLENIGGTFNYRKINGTNRISMHSYGMTIDINVKYSSYWQWACNCTDENRKLAYKNAIPLELVRIFEKHGFIWGGNWYHFDTMHFEYRPELLD